MLAALLIAQLGAASALGDSCLPVERDIDNNQIAAVVLRRGGGVEDRFFGGPLRPRMINRRLAPDSRIGVIVVVAVGDLHGPFVAVLVDSCLHLTGQRPDDTESLVQMPVDENVRLWNLALAAASSRSVAVTLASADHWGRLIALFLTGLEADRSSSAYEDDVGWVVTTVSTRARLVVTVALAGNGQIRRAQIGRCCDR